MDCVPLLDLAACSLYGFGSAFGYINPAHCDDPVNFARLDQAHLLGGAANEPGHLERIKIDHIESQAARLVKPQLRCLGLNRRAEAHLWQTTLNGHLAAFKANLAATARA